MLVDLITAIIRRGGLFNLGEEFRKVIQLEWRLMLLQKRHHLPRNVTFIEAVARGDDSGCAAFGCCGAFSFDHESQRMRESGQLDRFTGFIHRAVGLQPIRSEEHTSELQSPCNLVCRLLLEKKKKISSK